MPSRGPCGAGRISGRVPWKGANLQRTSRIAIEMKRPRLVGIAGGTGSGKTTLAHAIGHATHSSVIIPMDNYYKRTRGLTQTEKAALNYDHPDAYDWALLGGQMKSLLAGRAIRMPIYSYELHDRTEEDREVAPADLIILEGILALHDRSLNREMDLKIFIDADEETRFSRRLERDVRERGRSSESVKNQFETTVMPMHDLFVEPTRAFADTIVDGTVPFSRALVDRILENL
ncbi:uridine kinase [Thermodesulfobacteriota bacterium]